MRVLSPITNDLRRVSRTLLFRTPNMILISHCHVSTNTSMMLTIHTVAVLVNNSLDVKSS